MAGTKHEIIPPQFGVTRPARICGSISAAPRRSSASASPRPSGSSGALGFEKAQGRGDAGDGQQEQSGDADAVPGGKQLAR